MPESPLEQRPEPAVISDPAQADLELASLDVDWVVVWDVLLAAQDFYLSLTRNNPSFSFPHVTGSVVRGLRDGLAEHFTPRSLFGLPVTTHHSLGFTILVVRGTPETGLVNGNPSNRSPRGPTGATGPHSFGGGSGKDDEGGRRLVAGAPRDREQVAHPICRTPCGGIGRRAPAWQAGQVRRDHCAANIGPVGPAAAGWVHDVDRRAGGKGAGRRSGASCVAGLSEARDSLAAAAQLVREHRPPVRTEGR